MVDTVFNVLRNRSTFVFPAVPLTILFEQVPIGILIDYLRTNISYIPKVSTYVMKGFYILQIFFKI